MEEIELPTSVFCYARVSRKSRMLSRTGYFLSKGDHVKIGKETMMIFDHQDLPVVPFSYDGTLGYFLLREMKSSTPARTKHKLLLIKGKK